MMAKPKCTVRNTRRLCVLTVFVSSFLSAWLHTEYVYSSTSRFLLPLHRDEDNVGNHFKSTGSVTSDILRESVTIGKSRLVPQDEFVYKYASRLQVDEYFRFDEISSESLREKFRKNLKAFWSCGSEKKASKLVFTHIYRSAGTALRALLRAYGNICHAGVAIVSHCLDLGLFHMKDDRIWTNTGYQSTMAGVECVLSTLEERGGHRHVLNETSTLSTKTLQDLNIDILGGHVPIGSDALWTDVSTGQHVDAHYVVLFRDPLRRYLSQILFKNQLRMQMANNTNNTFGEAEAAIPSIVAQIQQSIQLRLSRGLRREKLSNFLISPEQRYWGDRENVEWTLERRVNISKANLVHNNILIGIVEHMGDSLHMIQAMIDGERRLGGAYDFYQKPHRTGNRSLDMTELVLKRIQANATLHGMMKEYLKHEYAIYDYAMFLHKIQVDSILGKRGSTTKKATIL